MTADEIPASSTPLNCTDTYCVRPDTDVKDTKEEPNILNPIPENPADQPEHG